MISCQELAELLCDFVSDELPPERRQHIELHLKHCPSCFAFHQSYALVVKLTRLLPATPLPPSLSQRLATALGHQPSTTPPGSSQV